MKSFYFHLFHYLLLQRGSCESHKYVRLATVDVPDLPSPSTCCLLRIPCVEYCIPPAGKYMPRSISFPNLPSNPEVQNRQSDSASCHGISGVKYELLVRDSQRFWDTVGVLSSRPIMLFSDGSKVLHGYTLARSLLRR